MHAYNHAGGWKDVDSLEPWQGYLVLYTGKEKEVSVELLPEPVPSPVLAALPKTGAPVPRGLILRMSLDGSQPLRLGASAGAADGLGPEDESQPPIRADKAPRLWSLRGNRALGTDMQRWRPGSLYRWKIVAGLPSARTSTSTCSTPPARSGWRSTAV